VEAMANLEKPEADAVHPEKTASTVFVVDDDERFLVSLSRLLNSAGLSVQTFASAKEFLDTVRPDAPSCLVLDLRMPGMSGLEMQERLAAEGNTIPIVFLSGHASFQAGVRAMKTGAVDFLAKPCNDVELIATIERALKRDALAREQRALHEKVRARLARLTPRERQVCDLVAAGRLSKQIAGELGAAEKTIKCHRGRVMEKLGVKSVAELVRLVDLAREA
jgi:FixJ family two-component response regulator